MSSTLCQHLAIPSVGGVDGDDDDGDDGVTPFSYALDSLVQWFVEFLRFFLLKTIARLPERMAHGPRPNGDDLMNRHQL